MTCCGIVLALMAAPATAAVRQCGQTVASEIVTAATERAAKAEALSQWRAKAIKAGIGFDSWRLANGKALKCFKIAGGYQCVAIGEPCVIVQAPKSPPARSNAKDTGA